MKTQHILFIGTKFIYNKEFQNYILRSIEKKVDFISSISFFKDNDNSLFLYLEQELNTDKDFIIITTKQNFSLVGKIISTVTSDIQVYKDNMLIPQKSSIFSEASYILEYQKSIINVVYIDEMYKMPEILIEDNNLSTIINVFEEDKDSLEVMLSLLGQTYEVDIEITKIIDKWMKVKISSRKYGTTSNFVKAAKKLLSRKVIEQENIVEFIIEMLTKENKKISFAESCTGGLLTYYFTKHNGASAILDGSLITYSNKLKENWLAVDSEIIEQNGAVSFEVVKEMSEGAMDVSNADYTLSISGIAGDSGGTDEKPVGTVYIGLKTKNTNKEQHLLLNGDRNYIQHQSVLYALKMLVLGDKDMFFKEI